MKNVISIDVEQWFHRFTLQKYVRYIDPTSEHIVKATKKILEIFENYGKKTTFFVLGEVAGYIPDIVKNIVENEHEIALHGYSHASLQELGEVEFKEQLKKGISILYHITKHKPLGFRAPNFSVSHETVWALKILKKNGFRYDSSIFPVKTPQYGLQHALDHPYSPSLSNPEKEDLNQSFIEFPMLTRKIGFLKVPAAGGFYLRLLGLNFVVKSIQEMNKRGYPAMCYIHPWEVYGFPRVSLPIHKKLYAYYRIPCSKLFEKLIKKIDVAPAAEVLETMEI